MLDPAIEAFFTDRKEGWLKKNLKASMSESEVKEKESECESQFALKNWIPKAASRIQSRAFTSHPSTFTHSSTGVGKKNKKEGTYVTPILYKGYKYNDGFLRSGNVECGQLDSIGNAADLDVESFLSIVLFDGNSVLSHIEHESEQAKLILLDEKQYNLLRNQFLSIKSQREEQVTSSKIKQVYFPIFNLVNDSVENDIEEEHEYHLLSPLTPSGLVFEMRRRIDDIRFSEHTKAIRELKRKGEFSEVGYKEIYGITTIGYGGTKPQNISVLNNQNAGKAHLLLSLPPEIKIREIRLPKNNFFSEVINPWQLKETYEAFHRLISLPQEKRGNRFVEYRDNRIQEYIDHIIMMMWEIRRAFEQKESVLPNSLPEYQRTWLFPDEQDERDNSDEWLQKLIPEIARQFFRGYEKVVKNKFLNLSDRETDEIAALVAKNKELLR